MKDNFEVFKYLDAALVAEEMGAPYASRTPAVWPSEASAIRIDKTLWNIIGKCHRAAYMRMMGFEVTNPPEAKSAWKWIMGREIEKHLTMQAQWAGIYVAEGVKHWIKDIMMSIEMDVVSMDPDTKRGWILECKTIGGYYAVKEVINDGRPKPENLIQLCMYLVEARTGKRLKEIIRKSLADRDKLEAKKADLAARGIEFEHRNRCFANLVRLDEMSDGPLGAKLLYVDRGDALRKPFTVEVFEDFDGSHYPMVDGIPYKEFTIESVYSRYQTLQGYWFRARAEATRRLAKRKIKPPKWTKLVLAPQDVQDKDDAPFLTPEQREAESEYFTQLEEEVRNLPAEFLPPCEYEWSYSPDRIELLRQHEAIGKTKYNDYKKGKIERLGAWQCAWCSYLHTCLKLRRPDLVYQIEDLTKVPDGAEVIFGT